MNDVIEDMMKAVKAIENNETALEMVRKEFYSNYEVEWLMEFSKTTPYSYDDWRSACMHLINNKVVPTLHNLHHLSLLCCHYNTNPLSYLTN